LLSAGLTSAITAPLAVASGISELFNWPREAHENRYRLLWASVLLTGVLTCLCKPLSCKDLVALLFLPVKALVKDFWLL